MTDPETYKETEETEETEEKKEEEKKTVNDESPEEESAPKEKKKKNPLKVLCILLCVLLVLGGTFFAFGDVILNSLFGLFAPDIHFKYICAVNAIDISKEITDEGVQGAKKVLENKTVEGEATLKAYPGGTLSTFTESLGISDPSILCEYEITKNKSLSSFDLDLSLGKKSFVSLEARADLKTGKATVAIPELSDKALSYTVKELKEVNLPDSDTVMELIPEKKLSSKLAVRYLLTAFGEVRNVDRKKEELTVGDSTEKLTKLTARITSETLYNIADVTLKKAASDKDIKKYILENSESVLAFIEEVSPNTFEEYKGLSPEELYERLCDDAAALREKLDKIRDLTPKKELFALTFWINAKGEILALDARVIKYAGVYLAAISEDGETDCEFSVYTKDKTYLSLKGELRDEDGLFFGDHDITVMDKTLELEYSDIDGTLLRQGCLNGNIKLVDGSSKVSVQLECESDGDTTEISGTVGYRSAPLFLLTAEGEERKPAKPALHTDCVELSEWKSIFSEKNLEKLLKKSGLSGIFDLAGAFMKK